MAKKAISLAELNVVSIANQNANLPSQRTVRHLEIGKKAVPIEDDPNRELLLVWNSGPKDVEIINEEGERLSKLTPAGNDFVYYPGQRGPISARVVA
jgi:hypothetical protein